MITQVTPDEIRIGHYVLLKDVPWLAHDFIKTSFLIDSEKTLKAVKAIEGYPLYIDEQKSQLSSPDHKPKPPVRIVAQQKKKSITEFQKAKRAIRETEKVFSELYKTGETIVEDIITGKIINIQQIAEHTSSIASHFSRNKNTTLCVLNSEDSDESHFCHSMNVAVMSGMLYKATPDNTVDLESLILAALLHDIGKNLIPKQALLAMEQAQKMNSAQRSVFEKHPFYSVKTLSGICNFPQTAMEAIYQHHERLDGSGYPRKVKGKAFLIPSQFISIANEYDRMINCNNVTLKLAPHKALSILYTKARSFYSTEVLDSFIKMLGIYPPGSILKTKEGDIALVISVEETDLLNPTVVIYDPHIPQKDAPLVKLQSDLSTTVIDVLTPEELGIEEREYLNVRTKSVLGVFSS